MNKIKEELSDPKIRKRILDLRNKGFGYRVIKEKLEKEEGIKTTAQTIHNLYRREIATKLIHSEDNRKTAEEDYKKIHERYEKACRWVDKLGESIEKLYYKLDPETYLKYAPTILATSREILNQLDFLRREQEKITIQQKNLIYSPIQITTQIHKNLTELEKNGYIKVLKKIESEDE